MAVGIRIKLLGITQEQFDKTRVAVLMDVADMDVADMDALKAAMETPEAADAMAHDGVVPRDARDPCRGIARV